MKIFFIENTKLSFDGNDKYNNKLRGGETVLINLSESLAKIGNDVTIFNNCSHNSKKINNVTWRNIELLFNKKIDNKCDVCLVQADANLLDYTNAKGKYVISHSVQTLEKFINKKQLFYFFKHKPKVIVASDYHNKTRSFLTSSFGKVSLFWSVDKMFSNEPVENSVPKKIAIFTTRPDRNLKKLLSIWNNKIIPNSSDSVLYINPPFELTEKDKNIKLRQMSSQKNLLEELKHVRVMLVPGHKGEIFCLAAQESIEMCIPIVTFGIGALRERVEHNVTGFIANNDDEFAKYALMILNDDSCWLKLRNNLIARRGKKTWDDAAKKLYQSFLLNIA